MLSREENRLEQEARVKGALEPSGNVWGGQESRIVRQQRGVFSVGCEFCIGSRAARDYFFLRAL